MGYNNEVIVSPNWPSFSRTWKIVAIILFLLLVILWFLEASPWSKNGGVCAALPPATADASAPFVNLNCNSVVRIPVGTGYDDPGAAAMDNIDGEATVVVSGEVDSNTPGEYVLTYTATDEAGNTSSATRTVIVEAQETVVAVPEVAKLYFENNSAEFPADVELSLAAVIAYLQRNKDLKAVISGFHSAVGSLERNQELARQRAESVSQLLQKSGIGASRIVMEKAVQTTGSGTAEEARRVEVGIRLQ